MGIAVYCIVRLLLGKVLLLLVGRIAIERTPIYLGFFFQLKKKRKIKSAIFKIHLRHQFLAVVLVPVLVRVHVYIVIRIL